MPRCIVYGPKDLDIVSIVTSNFPKATITRFDESGGITGIFPDNPQDTLKALGLHVTILEEDLSMVIWQPFIIKPAFSAPVGSEQKLAELLRQRFNARPIPREKTKFEIPIPVPTFNISTDNVERHRREYELKMEVVDDIQDFMKQNGIPVELGLTR